MIAVLIPGWNFYDNTDVRLRHGKRREGLHKSLRGVEGADTRCQSPKGGRPGVSNRRRSGRFCSGCVTTSFCRVGAGIVSAANCAELPHLGRSASHCIERGGVVIDVVSRRKMIFKFLGFWGIEENGFGDENWGRLTWSICVWSGDFVVFSPRYLDLGKVIRQKFVLLYRFKLHDGLLQKRSTTSLSKVPYS